MIKQLVLSRHRAQCSKRGQAEYFDGKEVVQLRTRKINSHFLVFQVSPWPDTYRQQYGLWTRQTRE